MERILGEFFFLLFHDGPCSRMLLIINHFSVASNAFGKVESVGHVHIVGPSVKGGKCPLFQSRPETEMLIMTGDPFSLSFRIIGEPKPKC